MSLPKGREFYFFENSPVPSCPKEGLHRFPLNPLSPQGTGDLTGKPAVLYSQTSSRPCGVARGVLRNRVAIVLRNRIAII